MFSYLFLWFKSATEERIFDTLVETLKFYLEVSQCLALGLKRGKTFMFKVPFVEEIYCTWVGNCREPHILHKNKSLLNSAASLTLCDTSYQDIFCSLRTNLSNLCCCFCFLFKKIVRLKEFFDCVWNYTGRKVPSGMVGGRKGLKSYSCTREIVSIYCDKISEEFLWFCLGWWP